MDNSDAISQSYYKLSRREMISFIPVGVKKVLDVGCAEGDFGYILKAETGAEVWGIEIKESVAVKAEVKLDKVIIGDIESLPMVLPKEYFDCIIFNDVLEHTIDPWHVIKSLKENLSYGGYVVASIPNIRYYKVLIDLVFKKKFEYEIDGVLDKTHLRFFTVKSIPEIFTCNGFQIEMLKGLKWENLPFKCRILNKLLKNALEDTRYKQYVCVAKKE